MLVSRPFGFTSLILLLLAGLSACDDPVAVPDDGEGPALTVAAAAGPATWDSLATLNVAVRDTTGLRRVTYSLNGGSPRSVPMERGDSLRVSLEVGPLSPGMNVIRVEAVDRAGNRAEQQVSLRRNLGPAFQLSSFADGDTVFGRALPLRITIGHGWTRLAYVLNGGEERPFYPEFGDVYDLRDGTNEIVLRSYVQDQLAAELPVSVHAEVASRRYAVATIPAPAGDSVAIADVNNHGHVAGALRTGAEGWRPFVWREGAVSMIPAPGRVFDINDRGQVLTGGYSRVYLWQEGAAVVEFPGGPGALNELGQVAVPGEPVPGGSGVNVWTDGQATRLSPPSSTLDSQPTVFGMNNRGVVVGSASDFYTQYPRVSSRWWEPGSTGRVGMLGGDIDSRLTAVNDAGTAVGVMRRGRTSRWGHLRENSFRSVLRAPSGGTDLNSWVGLDATADGINQAGHVAGTFLMEGERRAYTWEDGRMVEVALAEAGIEVISVGDINDKGQIAATGRRSGTGEMVGLLLTPEN